MMSYSISRFKVSPRGLMFGRCRGGHVSNERRFVVLRRLAILASNKFEAFNNTSGINCSSVYPYSLMHSDRQWFERRYSTLLFNQPHFGHHKPILDVLERERVTLEHFDTARMWGIPVSDQWFDASKYYNAKLKYSFNRSHPNALFVQDVLLGFGVGYWGKIQPHVSFVYGYRRDGSSWSVTIAKQRKNETLGQMLKRAERAMARICEPASRDQIERDRIYARLLGQFDGRNVNCRAIDEKNLSLYAFESQDFDTADYHPYFWSYRTVNALSHLFASTREIKVSDDDMRSVFMELKRAINNGRRRALKKARS